MARCDPTDLDAYEACIRACTPTGSDCIGCIFGIGFECAILGPCQNEYQDLGCCSLDSCGRVDFMCADCQPEIDRLIECAESELVEMECTQLEEMCFE